MVWRDRTGQIVPGDPNQDRLLKWMYGTAVGRGVVRVMIRPGVSRAAGALMNTRLSAVAIRPFRKVNNISLEDYEPQRYRSFNAFFMRTVREDCRPIDTAPSHLIAPCDSKLTVFSIDENRHFLIKGTNYTLESLLKDKTLAKRFAGGTLLLFRLTVSDYHHYCFIESGTVREPVRIPGVFHTVNPAAAEKYPIYKENTREFVLLNTESLGTVLQMEVGAAMVGKIANEPKTGSVSRGEEKGHFEFGGSTIIVLLQKHAAVIDEDILRNTNANEETVVRMGERIGRITRFDS